MEGANGRDARTAGMEGVNCWGWRGKTAGMREPPGCRVRTGMRSPGNERSAGPVAAGRGAMVLNERRLVWIRSIGRMFYNEGDETPEQVARRAA